MIGQTHIGDCRELLKAFAGGGITVQTVVTSPPYWGLRDYGVAGQLGLERTPEEYVAAMVEVFRAVREVLAENGTVWLNLGDSYAGSGRGGNPTRDSSTLEGGHESQEASMVKRSAKAVSAAQRQNCPPARGSRLPAGFHEQARQAGAVGRAWVPPPVGLKQKDLVGIPWMVAFALRADGWYLRQEIIWNKPNPMPESVRDRCTKAHEQIFLLAKSDRYYFDQDAIAEPVAGSTVERLTQPTIDQQRGSDRVPGKTNGPMKGVARKDRKTHNGNAIQRGFASQTRHVTDATKRNKRSVWTVTTKPYTEAHFATFPPDLIEPCILAGSRPGDVVLDPFMGSGTTAQVAEKLGRRWIGCELNGAYAPLQRDRTRQRGLALGAA